MKTKQSAKAKAAEIAEMTQDPVWPSPAPIELATLAAILRPNSRPKEAMEVAMQFYVEAELFFRRAPHAKRDQLRLFGDRERRFAAICEEFQENVEVEQRERLRLDPRADYDEARQFLSEHGLNWKNARTVIGNFKRIWKTEEWDSLDSYKHTENGKTDYLIPKVLLKEIAEDVLARRSESRRKGWKTRQINSSV